jgi:hypothetical protein
MSGPTTDGSLCCYTTTTCIVGRPLVVAGQVRAAPAVLRGDWTEPSELRVEHLDERARAWLAHAWLDDARLEHASVAAFARLTLELLALGAPAELVRAAQDASLDEIEHARLCYGIASRFGGADVGPGPLAVDGALGEISLAELARATFQEGCVGETVAALVAAEQARTTIDGSIARALDRISQEETRHAALAWRVVRWAISVGGDSIVRVVERALSDVLGETAPVAAAETEIDPELALAYGRLPPSELAAIRAEALRDVVVPCLRSLLGGAERATEAHVA